ncbi:MAG: hypothetical protein LDL19_06275 [Thiobacillus sp.]|nr:hypothetical protein [Thiobacillus sp.]
MSYILLVSGQYPEARPLRMSMASFTIEFKRKWPDIPNDNLDAEVWHRERNRRDVYPA